MQTNFSSKKQQGFLLPMAIFIVVVMGVFALVLSRNTIQSNTSAVQEIISTQTFYAAESGAQRAMQSLFFPDASSRQQTDARCAGAVNTTYTFAVDGLNNCTAVVSCVCAYQDASTCNSATAANYSATSTAETLTSFYTLASAATCGSGNLRAQRTVSVGAFLHQE